MPGMGLAVALEDSICHHFMGGAFSHCTSICVLETILPRRSTTQTIVGNINDFFRVFAWGSAANTRTARSNASMLNVLKEHRLRKEQHRSTTRADNIALSTRVECSVGDQEKAVVATRDTTPNDKVRTTYVVPADAGPPTCNVFIMPFEEATGGTSDTEYQTESSVEFQYEDEYYTDDELDDKRMRGKQRRELHFIVGCTIFYW